MKTVYGLNVHKDSIFCTIHNRKTYWEVKEYETATGSIYYSMDEYLKLGFGTHLTFVRGI
jgi:hypothetical protein